MPTEAEIGELDVAAMKKMFETNVFGLVDITNRVVPLLKAQQHGDIVNIASTSGMKGGAGATPTAAASGRCEASASAGRRSSGRTASASPACARRKSRRTLAAGAAATTRTSCTPRTSQRPSWRRLNMPRRALWPELAVFANNPWKED